MELYKRFPRFCTLWCCVEITLYAGQLFGWSSLLFVLKQEGFYENLCYLEYDVDLELGHDSARVMNVGKLHTNGPGYHGVHTTPQHSNVPYTQNSNLVTEIAERNKRSNETVSEKHSQSQLKIGSWQPFSASHKLQTRVPAPYTLNADDRNTGNGAKSLSLNSVKDSTVASIAMSANIQNDVELENSADQIPYYIKNKTRAHIPIKGDEDKASDIGPIKGCSSMDSQLNLWFSVAICISYVMCAFLGPLMTKIGMRMFRLFFMVIYVIGALCLGFATPAVPWLLCPGLCCIGVAGMALYCSSIQVSFLFLAVQSTITSLFVGLYDVSTIVTQLVKVAHENDVSRKTSFIILAVGHVALVGVSTFILLPYIHIDPTAVRGRGGNNRNEKHSKGFPDRKENEHGNSEKAKEEDLFIQKFVSKQTGASRHSLKESLLSIQYVLHVFWMCVLTLRFVTFLGFMNSWLETKLDGDEGKKSHYLSVFSYITMGTFVAAITAGMLHDCQRRKYLGRGDYQRERLPIILPLLVSILLSIAMTTFTFIENEAFLYVLFVLFTIYRSYLFSFEVTFINDIFPLQHFPILFGVLHSSGGLAGMLQYPLFQWYESYELAPLHVSIFQLCLEIATFIHPCYLWYKCRTHKNESSNFYLNNELYI